MGDALLQGSDASLNQRNSELHLNRSQTKVCLQIKACSAAFPRLRPKHVYFPWAAGLMIPFQVSHGLVTCVALPLRTDSPSDWVVTVVAGTNAHVMRLAAWVALLANVPVVRYAKRLW